jgi:hypothetical protein
MLDLDEIIAKQYKSILGIHFNEKPFERKKILFSTSIASFDHGIQLDKLIALSLFMRGHEVEFMFCDSVIPICQVIKYGNYKPPVLVAGNHTPRCMKCTNKIPSLEDLPFAKIHKFSDFYSDSENNFLKQFNLDDLSIAQICDLKIGGINIGPQIRAGIVRYFANPSFEDEFLALEIAKKYAKAALITWNVYRKYIDDHSPDVIVAHHGIYVPQGIIALIAKHYNIKFVAWNPSYRNGTFLFSHDESYHYTMLSENNNRWENIVLKKDERRKIKAYLKSRESGRRDWIKFTDSMPKSTILNKFLKKLNPKYRVEKSGYRFGLLTNVAWDADLHFDNNSFSSMQEWLFETIKFFVLNPEIELLIRVHPAEHSGNVKSRQRVSELISQNFQALPKNITIIDSQDPVNTYELMKSCDSIIIYGTKAGIEFAFRGKQVIICGESWIKGKGIGVDVNRKEDYFAILKSIATSQVKKLDAIKLDRAEKYAFYFFFKRMIFLPWFKLNSISNLSTIELNDVLELKTGKNKNLDVICEGIVSNSPFEAMEIGI